MNTSEKNTNKDPDKNSNKNSNKEALKSGVWYTFSNFLLQGMAFITTPIFARLLTKADYGAYSNYVAWFSIVVIVCTIEFKSSVSRAYYDFKDDFDGYLSSVTWLGTFITAAFYIIVLTFHGFFEKLLGMDLLLINIMFINVLFAPALEILQAKHRIELKYKAFVVISVITTLLSTFLSVLLVVNMKDRLLGRIIGQSAPMLVAYIIAFIVLIKAGKTVFKASYWKYAVAFSLPIVPHLLSNTILGSSDKIMITNMVGKEATASYSLAYSCGMIIAVLFTSMNQAWVPWLYDRLYKEEYGLVNRISKLYMIVFVIMVEGSILLAPELMLILGGKGYSESAYIVAPIMLGYGFKFAYTLYVNLEQFEKKTFFISVGTITSALVNIILNLILIPIFGYRAAAYTTMIGFILLFIMHMIFSTYILKLKNAYSNSFIILMLIVMTACGLLSSLLYQNTIARYIVIGLLAVAGLILLYRLYVKYRSAGKKI
ncbi:MAG: oligosaccharide flippase family protein [Lachnospiraceae bacterium]|nr:oligosaccharide flippase family protein [Lachnospiraceae bacterium]